MRFHPRRGRGSTAPRSDRTSEGLETRRIRFVRIRLRTPCGGRDRRRADARPFAGGWTMTYAKHRSLFALDGLLAALVLFAACARQRRGHVVLANVAAVTPLTLANARARRSACSTSRRKRGLRPLAPSMSLRHAAERHSTSMVTRRYFAHGNFVGRIRSRRVPAHAGFWRSARTSPGAAGKHSSPARVMRVDELPAAPGEHPLRPLPPRGDRHRPRHAPGGSGGTYTTDFGARR